MGDSKDEDIKELKDRIDKLERIINEGFNKLCDNELHHIQYSLRDIISGVKEIERISSLHWQIPEIVIVEEMTKEAAKQKVVDFMREHRTSDIAELHKNIRCDIRLLVEIIDELRREEKIEEEVR